MTEKTAAAADAADDVSLRLQLESPVNAVAFDTTGSQGGCVKATANKRPYPTISKS